MEQRFSSGPDNSSSFQEIPCPLWKPNIHYDLMLYICCVTTFHTQNLTPTCCTMFFIRYLMLQHVSALAAGHLHGAH